MTMTRFETDKAVIVSAVLKLLPEDENINHKTAMLTWWSNIRNRGGLGLSHTGDQMFQWAELESYEFEIGDTNSLGNLAVAMMLNKKMLCPHYFYSNNRKRYVRVYDSRIAMLITLCDSIDEYLKRLDNITENDDD